MSQQLEQLFQICNLISRLKWKLGTSRYIIEHLMHAYTLSTRYIIFPAVTYHQRFTQFRLSSRNGKSQAMALGHQYHLIELLS